MKKDVVVKIVAVLGVLGLLSAVILPTLSAF